MADDEQEGGVGEEGKKGREEIFQPRPQKYTNTFEYTTEIIIIMKKRVISNRIIIIIFSTVAFSIPINTFNGIVATK